MKTHWSIAALAVLALGHPAHAVPLAPGSAAALSGITFASNPEQGGVIIQDDLLPFTIVDPASPLQTLVGGTVQSRVVRSTVTGGLIFTPRIRDVFSLFGQVGARIRRLEYSGFANNGTFSTDVDFRIDGLGDEGATNANRSADGDEVGFALSLDVGSLFGSVREESKFLTILTNATHFNNTGSLTITATRGDGTGLFQTRIFGIAVPDVAPVPLPALALLLGAALAGLAGLRRRAA